MQDSAARDLRYPIGDYSPPAECTPASRARCIEQIEALPAELRSAVAGLSESQLATPYREGGWNAVQVVHHVADSHMNAYIRFKLALTEDMPTVKPYDEGAWAKLADTAATPLAVSLSLLEALHDRWTTLLRSFGPDEWQRQYRHPETGNHNLDYLLALYAWHGRHHTAHIASLRERMGW